MKRRLGIIGNGESGTKFKKVVPPILGNGKFGSCTPPQPPKSERPVINIGNVLKVSIDDSNGEDTTVLCVALVEDGNITVMETYRDEEALEAYEKFKLLKGDD